MVLGLLSHSGGFTRNAGGRGDVAPMSHVRVCNDELAGIWGVIAFCSGQAHLRGFLEITPALEDI